MIFIANVDESHLHNSPLVPFCGKVQAEISELDQNDQLEFLKAMGLDQTGLQKLVRTGYDILDLITFFTANQNEAHAWTVSRGSTVRKAAGKVHSDFEEKFIKAEVIKYSDLIEYGTMKELHDQGRIGIHGKDYIVADGDLILFRIG